MSAEGVVKALLLRYSAALHHAAAELARVADRLGPPLGEPAPSRGRNGVRQVP